MQHKKTVSFTVMIFMSVVVYSQTIDQKLFDLMSRNELFKLKRELQQTDSTKVSGIAWNMANAIVNTHFCKPQKAIRNLDILLNSYPDELGRQNVMSMAYLLLENYAVMREFHHASSIYKQFIEEFVEDVTANDLKYLKNGYRIYSAMAKAPKQKIPITNRSINLDSDKTTGFMNISASRNGKNHKLIFDIGSVGSVISESTGNDFGIKILQDSVIVRGATDVLGKIGVVDRIGIGEIMVENMIFYVVPDSLMYLLFGAKIDGAVACDFLRELKLFEIRDNKLFLNIKNDENQGNMIINKVPYVECISDSDTLLLTLDTKQNECMLSYLRYELYKNRVKSNRLKNFPIKIGDSAIVPYINIASIPEKISSIHIPNDGILSIGIIKLYKRMIVDFETMSVILKNN